MPVVAAAVIGTAGSLYAGSQQTKAANKAIDAQNAATAQQLALQKQVYETSVQNQAPYLNAGYGALPALQNQLGLSGVQGGQAGANYGAYLESNPDVAQFAADAVAQGYAPPGWSGGKIDTPEEAAAYHYPTYGQSEGRALPTTPTSADTLSQQVGQRSTYTRPEQVGLPSLPNLDPANYQKSASYDYQQAEGQRQLNSGYAAKGMLQSGAAIKGIAEFSQNLADQDYQQWADRQLQLYDKSFASSVQQNALNNTNFESDRTYGTSVYDADRNYDTNQYNTQTQNLFQLAGIGQNAAANTATAGSNYAANSGNALQTQANVLGAGYNQIADANASTANNIFGIGQNVLTGYGLNGGSKVNALSNASKTNFKYMN